MTKTLAVTLIFLVVLTGLPISNIAAASLDPDVDITDPYGILEFYPDGDGPASSDFVLGFGADRIRYTEDRFFPIIDAGFCVRTGLFEKVCGYAKWGRTQRADLKFDNVIVKSGWDVGGDFNFNYLDLIKFFQPGVPLPSYAYFETDIQGEVELTFDLYTEVYGGLTYTKAAQLFWWVPPIPIFAGPVLIVPFLWIEAGVQFDAGVALSHTIKPSFKATFDGHADGYFHGSMFTPVGDINQDLNLDVDLTFDYTPSVNAKIGITPFVHVGVAALVYGFIGPGFAFGPGVSLSDNYDVATGEHQICLKPVLRGNIGIKFPLGGLMTAYSFYHEFAPFDPPGCSYPGRARPIADFLVSPSHPIVDSEVFFLDRSTDDDGIESYLWDFGDDTTSTDQNPSHIYPNAGTYEVSLQVTDVTDLTDSIAKEITVYTDYDYPSTDLTVLSPTTSQPVRVGDPSNPIDFNARINIGEDVIVCYPEDAFEIRIGGKPANFVLYLTDLDNTYYFRVTPPDQSSEGSYDFEVTFLPTAEVEVESDAVIYSTGGNVDVMTVIDRSGSMSGGRIAAAKTASSLFVDLMADNDMIGVASFSSGASVNYPLTQITSPTIRQQAKNAINGLYSSGMTAIGRGLQSGYSQLVNNGDPLHPWSIVLLSDGHHNTGTHPNNVIPSLQAAQIRVITIGLGSGADHNLLGHIASQTNGQYYFSPSSEELLSIYSTIAGKVKAESIVKKVDGTVAEGETVYQYVNIDSSIDTATFALSWEAGTCSLELIRPDSSYVYDSDPDVSSHRTEANYETYTIIDPMPGIWTMEITRIHASSLKYTAIVTAATNVRLSFYTDRDDYYTNEPVQMIAVLASEGIPILNAILAVTIEKPDGSEENLLLHDDGAHGDGEALDGVYGNFFADNGINGDYELTLDAAGTLGTESYTRTLVETIHVSGLPSGELTVTPLSWETGKVNTGVFITAQFTVLSDSAETEIVSAFSTDFSNGTEKISADNVFFIPQTSLLPAQTSRTFYSVIHIPEATESGNYTGNLIIQSTQYSVSISVEICVEADNTPPSITVETPSEGQALQDGVTLKALATDPSGVDWVTFSIRESDGTIIDPMFESMSAIHVGDDTWTLSFDTTQLPDGYYQFIVDASDTLGNGGSTTVDFSIRNWACVELLPSSTSNKGGRTMPVKFSLRVAAAVDPAQPFVYNEELNIEVYRASQPANILQNSTYGTTARDYRINSIDELYITNFKTKKQPTLYVVEVYRKGMLLDSFTFETVK